MNPVSPTLTTQALRRGLLAAALCATLLGASGCVSTGLQSSALHPVLPNSGWLELQGGFVSEVSPGIWLQLPNAPYRARFADAKGVYYQASLPLMYRTQHGVVSPVPGGLYVQHDRPQEARSWTEPVLYTPTQVHPQRYPVKVFAGF